MNRLSTAVLTASFIAALGLTAVAAPSADASWGNTGTNAIAQATAAPSPAATAMPAPATAMPSPAATTAPAPATVPPMQFGSPPSGQIPILFNDHHVYARPDKLKQGRVLAALVRGGTILIPLRSMFEQMGATVSWDPASRTADVSKPGADVKVTVGRPQVIINGETRPLDVPPEIYQGVVVVPVRVISEGMGAYVQWVPDKRLVVVRYLPATPPPPPAPPPATPAPTPTPVRVFAPYQDHFIAGDYIISPKVYNEFSPGNTGHGSYAVRGAIEFDLFNLPWMLGADFRQWQYPHNQSIPTPANYQANNPLLNKCPINGETGCVTVIGGQGNTFVPAFTAQDRDLDIRVGLRVFQPRIYIAGAYIWRTTNYGYPREQGFGVGLEKLPDLDQVFSVYGSVYYFPNMGGTCETDVCPTGPFDLRYNLLKYQIGGALNFGSPSFPVFFDFGWIGDNGRNNKNAPVGFTHNGPYVGLGIHF